jgi:hypothetical protein
MFHCFANRLFAGVAPDLVEELWKMLVIAMAAQDQPAGQVEHRGSHGGTLLVAEKVFHAFPKYVDELVDRGNVRTA